MRYSIINFFVFIFALILNSNAFAEMTLEKLFFDNSQPFHLKILEAIPENGKVQIGPENAENTIIEFMDYFCGYCKKIHPELMKLTKVVVFSTLFFGIAVYLADLFIRNGISGVNQLIGMLFK